jgi:hypothetical protein
VSDFTNVIKLIAGSQTIANTLFLYGAMGVTIIVGIVKNPTIVLIGQHHHVIQLIVVWCDIKNIILPFVMCCRFTDFEIRLHHMKILIGFSGIKFSTVVTDILIR